METREIRLARRPHGEPVGEDFELAVRELGEPGEGQVLVRNRYMSVDPYMRGRMNDRKSYVPPFELGKALQGGAVGEVVGTGDLVVHDRGELQELRAHLEMGALGGIGIDVEAHLVAVDPKVDHPAACGKVFSVADGEHAGVAERPKKLFGFGSFIAAHEKHVASRR